jgi:hypothetical protein
MWLEFSVYWIFSVMVLDYAIKASLLFYRYRSRKWLDVQMDLPNDKIRIPV